MPPKRKAEEGESSKMTVRPKRSTTPVSYEEFDDESDEKGELASDKQQEIDEGTDSYSPDRYFIK